MDAEPEVSSPIITNAIQAALKMALSGDETQHGWYNGVLTALEGVSATRASRSPGPGRTTVAAHAEHVRFTLRVVNAWVRGQQPEIDWADSWTVSSVTDAEWDALRADIRREFELMLEGVQGRAAWRARGLEMLINNIAHTAYHAGAIRQILKLESAVHPESTV
jgi:hypothetical protein